MGHHFVEFCAMCFKVKWTLCCHDGLSECRLYILLQFRAETLVWLGNSEVKSRAPVDDGMECGKGIVFSFLIRQRLEGKRKATFSTEECRCCASCKCRCTSNTT